ncbi:Toxin RelK [Bacteroidales bacterium Barb6XT]|nr:Toxin RelK [Bacteroidales bacterium Barb6XT]
MERVVRAVTYKLIFTPQAKEDIARLRKSGDKQALKKLDRIREELEEHPKTGIGKPEQKKYGLSGYWSREITEKHRIIYRIQEETVTVVVVKAYGHYDDK